MTQLMTPVTITERIADWRSKLSIDRSRRLILNVALAGRESRNGYNYTSEALVEAVPLYEHKPVFLDHPPDRQKSRDRSTRDLAGSIINPRFEDGRVRGDIQVLETVSGQTLLALAETETPGIGMSHVVLAEKSADGKQVERIHDVISVDVVINPATTTTFQESIGQPPLTGSTSQAISPNQLSQLLQELGSLRQERGRLEEQVATIVDELAQLQTRVHVQQLIESVRITPGTVTPELRQQLEQIPDDQARRRLLHARCCAFREQTVPQRSSERVSTGMSAAPEEHFISAIRRK